MSATLTQSMRQISELLQSGRFDAAHAQLEALVAVHPDFVEGLRLYAGTKQILGETPQAEALLRRALAVDPRWTPTLAALAELLLGAGRVAEAIPLLQRAVQGMPRFPRAALLLARHYLDAGQPAAAFEVATPWCSGAPLLDELCTLHVAACAALGRSPEAVVHYRRLASVAPPDPVAPHALAMALSAAGQPVESESVARQALSRSRPSAALYHTHARSLVALERFEQAELALRACLRLEPRLAEAHNSLAQLVWMRTGSIGEATRLLDESLGQHPHDEALWATKAALLQGAADPQGAYACLADRAARADARPALLIRAGLAALEFEPATALALAERALAAQPANSTARKLLCGACLGVGDAVRALAECQTLLQATPDDQYLIAMQATALRLLDDARYGALCDYEQLVLSQPLDVPPGWPDLPTFLVELTARLNTLHNPHGHRLLYQSLRQGTETTQDLSRSEDPLIRALFQAFAAPIACYRAQIGAGSDPLRRRNRGTAQFNGSWSVRLQSSGFHTSHVHPRGWISSACYIDLPDSMTTRQSGEGILQFGAPGMLTTPPLPADWSVRPEVGQLVLFPSYFWHGTRPFNDRRPRLTVAFDVVPAGGAR